MIGIFIGIATVVSLVSLGQGLQESISEQFEILGVDKIIITPGESTLAFSRVKLTQQDLARIKRIKGVKEATGSIFIITKVESNDEVQYTWIWGIPQDESKQIIMDMQSVRIVSGRDLTERDRDKVMIGYRLTQPDLLFETPLDVRDTIFVNDRKMQVVGTLAQIGNPDDDSVVWMPLDVARDVLGLDEDFDYIIAQANKGFDVGAVAENIERQLRKSRGVEEGEEDFTVSTSEGLRETFGTVFTIVTVVLIGLAGISLFVGGVGIMNTMFTAVLQRTREIGVMKAIGATQTDIAYIFLLESGIIGLIGGSVGIALGIGISKLVEFAATQAGITFFKASFPLYLILGALAFSFFVGTLSGVLPAIQASKLQPVEALRYE